MSIQCDSDEHSVATGLAWFAVILYPVGVIVLCGILLLCARYAITHESKPTRLSQAIAFLHREYKPSFYLWEVMELLRRFFLVGLFQYYPNPGSLAQIVSATLLCVIYLFMQLQAAPFKSITDDYLAKVCSFFLVCLFACCTLFRLLETLEQPQM